MDRKKPGRPASPRVPEPVPGKQQPAPPDSRMRPRAEPGPRTCVLLSRAMAPPPRCVPGTPVFMQRNTESTGFCGSRRGLCTPHHSLSPADLKKGVSGGWLPDRLFDDSGKCRVRSKTLSDEKFARSLDSKRIQPVSKGPGSGAHAGSHSNSIFFRRH